VAVGYAVVFVALESLSLRRPKQTVQAARRRRMTEAKVNQKPGAVLVLIPDPSLFISCLTSAKRAISMAKAIRVNNAAKNESRDAMSVTNKFVERAKNKAINVAAAAIG